MGVAQRRCDVRHELLTQRALFFVLESMQKKGTLSQHFVMHVVPPLGVAGVGRCQGKRGVAMWGRELTGVVLLRGIWC